MTYYKPIRTYDEDLRAKPSPAPDEWGMVEFDTGRIFFAVNGAWVQTGGSGVDGITALTGDVTATGPGSVAATIANNAVTFAKMQTISTNRLLGRATAGTGNIESITVGTGLSFTGTTINADINSTTITNDTTTNATMYPTWVTASSGDLPLKVSSTKLSFNPSSGTLSTTAINIGSTFAVTGFIDDDTFATASATTGASSESIKAYVDAQVAIENLWDRSGTTLFPHTAGDGLYITKIVGSAFNNILTFTTVASPVNYFDMTGSATGSGPILSALGSDTNININVTPKGSGLTNFTTGDVKVLAGDGYIYDAIDPTLYISEASSTSSYFALQDQSAGQAAITKVSASGVATIQLNPSPSDGVSASNITIFRATNTTATKRILMYKGDGTATVHNQIATDGSNTYFAGGGNFGIGTSLPTALLTISGGATSRAWFTSTAVGASSIAQTHGGFFATAGGMNTTSKFTPGYMFGSTDSEFTTTNPKMLAGIVGVAVQAYTADTTSGMGIEFFTTANTAGATPTPISRMFIDQNGRVGIGAGESIANAVLHIGLTGLSQSAWTTNGIGLRISSATYTDTSSSGTVAANVVNAFAVPTLTANSVTTYTDASTVYIAGAPTASTNVTINNANSLWVDDGFTRLDGNVSIGGAASGFAKFRIRTNLTSTGAVDTNGSAIWIDSYTHTNQGATGTIATWVANGFNTITVARNGANTPTYTDAANIYVTELTAGTGVTLTNNYAIWSTGKARIDGAVSIKTSATPTAHLHLGAGTTAAGTAPLKFTAGSLLTTPEAGVMNYANDKFYITNVATQRAIDRTSDVITSTTTVTDTVTETTVFTGTIGANDMKVGNVFKVVASGVITNATASDDITLNVYVGSTLICTLHPAILNVTDADWDVKLELTIRSIGGSGSVAAHCEMDINANFDDNNQIITVDTTTSEDITIKAQWDNAKPGNIFSIYQGWMEVKN